MKMVAGSFYIPKKNPKSPLGEDSHFIDEVVKVIGVVDGVGNIKYRGIDAGEFARKLMGEAAEIVKKHRYPIPSVNPRQVFDEAFWKSKSPGACTMCIMALNGNLLKAVNMGNSGFVVIRQEKVVFRSPVQPPGFHRQYQMGKKKGTGLDLAEDFWLPMQAGDVIIAGSDGLFDNLFPEEIEKEVKISLQQKDQPNVLAKNLATAALEKSLDRSCETPFAVAARVAGLVHNGGKYDDITVVAAYVQAISASYVQAVSKPKSQKFYGCKWWGKIKSKN